MEDFSDCINSCEVTEHNSQGPFFTWINNRSEGLISRRLDRVFTSLPWQQHFQGSKGVWEQRDTNRPFYKLYGAELEAAREALFDCPSEVFLELSKAASLKYENLKKAEKGFLRNCWEDILDAVCYSKGNQGRLMKSVWCNTVCSIWKERCRWCYARKSKGVEDLIFYIKQDT
ncbi:hypothetical protein LINPERPRIM_LOCUS37359, partial [Linum perenne]